MSKTAQLNILANSEYTLKSISEQTLIALLIALYFLNKTQTLIRETETKALLIARTIRIFCLFLRLLENESHPIYQLLAQQYFKSYYVNVNIEAAVNVIKIILRQNLLTFISLSCNDL